MEPIATTIPNCWQVYTRGKTTANAEEKEHAHDGIVSEVLSTDDRLGIRKKDHEPEAGAGRRVCYCDRP